MFVLRQPTPRYHVFTLSRYHEKIEISKIRNLKVSKISKFSKVSKNQKIFFRFFFFFKFFVRLNARRVIMNYELKNSSINKNRKACRKSPEGTFLFLTPYEVRG